MGELVAEINRANYTICFWISNMLTRSNPKVLKVYNKSASSAVPVDSVFCLRGNHSYEALSLHTSCEIFHAYISKYVCVWLYVGLHLFIQLVLYHMYTFASCFKKKLDNMIWRSFPINIEKELPFVFLIFITANIPLLDAPYFNQSSLYGCFWLLPVCCND